VYPTCESRLLAGLEAGNGLAFSLGVILGRRRPTFEEIARSVLELKRLKSKNTRLCARFQINRLIRFFGRRRIDEITENLWTDYVVFEREKRERLFYDDRKYMRMILIHAVRSGALEKRIPLPIPDIARSVGREITHSELVRLRLHASDELALQIDIGWKMGLRLREMLHLRWDQFDWERATITLLPSDTKTRRGRVIPITTDLLPRFWDLRASTKSPYVFPRSASKPLRPQHSNRSAWRQCKRNAGVRARWHDLRHTCATLMLRRGVKRHIVRAYLGMSDKVLMEIYAHLNLEDLEAAAAVMSEAS
jgi:integrase